jgi:hypothetical protein
VNDLNRTGQWYAPFAFLRKFSFIKFFASRGCNKAQIMLCITYYIYLLNTRDRMVTWAYIAARKGHDLKEK